MNAEPPPMKGPEQGDRSVPKMVWVMVALAPAVLLIMVFRDKSAPIGNVGIFVAFGVNPLLSFVGCYGLFHRPGRSKVTPIVGGIFLGAFFAVLNLLISALIGGCALSGTSFH